MPCATGLRVRCLRLPRAQNGRSSSSSGGPSHIGGPSRGASSAGGAAGGPLRRGVEGGYGLGEPSRAGQITPSQPGPPRSRGLLRHLKSGARGLRLDVRSSHIAPPQIGQSGIPAESTRGPPAAAAGRAAFAGGVDTGARVGGASAEARGGAGCDAPDAAPGAPVRGGQITPSQLRSLHLKSGAFGFRFPSRLSHIAPPHLGQLGTAAVVSV